jgi:hypothetical protein
MNEFDRHLEIQLRRFLDPVVATPVPVRRKAKDVIQTGGATGLIELPALALIAVPVEVFS